MLVPIVMAQDLSLIASERFVKANIKSNESVEMLADGFGLADINSDGFVSENELAMIINSVDFEINLTADEKSAKKTRLQEYFTQVDKNNDYKLDKKEYVAFMQKEAEFEAMAHIAKMQDLITKSPEEMVAENEANMAKLKSALGQLKEVPTEKLADNFIANISNAMADENYFQMDKDKNGCVTEEEYVDYMLIFAQDKTNNQESVHYQMTKNDWREMYRNEKKANSACLTKEEYINNFNEILVTD